nr:hypothetical protein GZ27E7_12 [uncultured archaeon GZfos27E7]
MLYYYEITQYKRFSVFNFFPYHLLKFLLFQQRPSRPTFSFHLGISPRNRNFTLLLSLPMCATFYGYFPR